MLSLPILAAIASTALWVVWGSLSKRIATTIASTIVVVMMMGIGAIPMIIAVLALGVYSIPASSVILACLAGVLATIGFFLTLRALRTEQLTNSTSFGELQPAILVLFGLFALGETITTAHALSMIVIFIGAFLIIRTQGVRINKRLVPAALSVVAWTIYWIVITYSVTWAGTFALPVAISRITGAVLAGLYLFLYRAETREKLDSSKRTRKGRLLLYSALALVIVAALADGTGDTAFAFALGAGTVAVSGAITALSPMFISIIGFLLYKDRLTGLQFVGLAVMIVGAVALSLL